MAVFLPLYFGYWAISPLCCDAFGQRDATLKVHGRGVGEDQQDRSRFPTVLRR